MSYEDKVRELGLNVPEVAKPVAAYVPAVCCDGYVYTSGQIPLVKGEVKYVGKLGRELSVADGYEAARICALNCLAAIRSVAGSLDNIDRVVKVVGFVNSAETFTEQPKVINGASELIGSVFGKAGEHARSAVGVGQLPLGVAVEVELIVKLKK
ncbi:MAG: RidA family protein [Sporomusaceae bacterium]|nr:RidA family protein [Sporomusaceae bacterium]